jgi:membrane protease YdiL (CAAX protease family)
MKKWIKTHSFTFYLAAAFTISWLGWLPLILGHGNIGFFNPWKLLAGFGPSLAGLAAIGTSEGKAGLRRLWHRLTDFRRTGWLWAIFGLGAPPAAMLTALGLHTLMGGQGLIFNDPAELYRVIPVFLLVLFFSVMGEEIGWRGFALPWLQKRMGALQASLILGGIWALWHLPLFVIPGDFHSQLPISWFVLQIITSTILYTWIFNATHRSLIIIHLFHAASNTAFGVLPMLPENAAGSSRPAWFLLGILSIAALAVILINGPQTLTAKTNPAISQTFPESH